MRPKRPEFSCQNIEEKGATQRAPGICRASSQGFSRTLFWACLRRKYARPKERAAGKQ